MVTAKPSPDLVELAEKWRVAFRAGDDEFNADHTGHGDVLLLGSAAEDEPILGREAVLAVTRQRVEEINSAAGLDTDPDPELETEAWEAGDTGWVVTHGSWRLADGSTVPTRSISVYARDDDGTWKGVFSAAHVLVPNDALRPDSPTYGKIVSASS